MNNKDLSTGKVKRKRVTFLLKPRVHKKLQQFRVFTGVPCGRQIEKLIEERVDEC